jgi:tetratricopeptide (TPR) repeat protein
MTIEEYLEKGNAALETDDLPAAREAFEAIIEESESHAPAWHGLGHVLLREGELDQALECYEYAFGEDEDLTPPWTALGHLAVQQDEDQQATQFYKNAIQLDPQDSEPWNGLGILYASKLAKPQEAARCFLRAEHLGGERHANNTFVIFSQLPPQPFFSYRTIRDYMAPAAYPQWQAYREAVLEEALPLRAYLAWQNLQIENGGHAPEKWDMWQGIIHFLMGDPAAGLVHLEKAQAKTNRTDLMTAYYQIQCAWDFVEPETRYLETAVAAAEKYVPEVKSSGWGPFAKKQIAAPPLPPAELPQCYYAGLVFIESDDLKKALLCFERIEKDFAPAAYLALWLTEELVLPKKKKQKAEVLLERENREHNFTEGINVYELSADTTSFLRQLTYVNHYLEAADAIDVLHYFAEFEGNPYDLEIQMGKDQPPFYQLWELPQELKDKFAADFRDHFYQQIESGLAEPLALLREKAGDQPIEAALVDATGAAEIPAAVVPALTAYFQYQGQLEAPARHHLDLYAGIQSAGDAEAADTEGDGPNPPAQNILFLLDALTQPGAHHTAGELAEHLEAWRAAWETPPADYVAFRAGLAEFIRNRPAPEPEEEMVVMEKISGEEE